MSGVATKEQRITESALRLFLRHGYRKVTMGDIAEACSMSRPSLYARFDNKGAVLSAILHQHSDQHDIETKERLTRKKTLKEKLDCIFEVWIIEPFAFVIDSENAAELLGNCAEYAPKAVDDRYARFEAHLVAALKPETTKRGTMTANDLAHILALATRGLKASTGTLPELRRMTAGLITMAMATVANS